MNKMVINQADWRACFSVQRVKRNKLKLDKADIKNNFNMKNVPSKKKRHKGKKEGKIYKFTIVKENMQHDTKTQEHERKRERK